MEDRTHWEGIYGRKADDEVSWYEASPDHSLTLVRKAIAQGARSVLDVGGGTSRLVDALLDDGLERLAVLDVSEIALDRAKERLGSRASGVEWIHADIAGVADVGPFDVWHDRALFHFLTSDDARHHYVKLLDGTVSAQGVAILATFGPEGPETCSGLPVQRYDATTLERELGAGFELLESQTVDHLTPRGRHQQFIYAVFARA